jgi:hypothetical protein
MFDRRVITRGRCVAPLVAVIAGLGGCAGTDRSSTPTTATGEVASPLLANDSGDVVAARWPFWPTAMRLHPLTLVSRDDKAGEDLIEARVEFVDSVGDTAKAVAQFRFELHEEGAAAHDAEPLFVWAVDLRDLRANALHFDSITRTYLFRLAVKGGLAAHGRVLHAYALCTDGARFESSITLR